MTMQDATTAGPLAERPRAPRGHRPNNLGNLHAERVLSITMAVATEVSALHEKLDTVIRVASERGTFSAEDIEAYQPSDEVRAARVAWRKEYLARLLRIMWDDIPTGPGDQRTETYSEFVEEISK